MKFLDYTFLIKAGKSKIEVDPTEYSFSIKDSIHQLYPTATMSFHDLSGLMQEYLTTSSLLEYELGFGDEEDLVISKYVIDYDYFDFPETAGFMSGNVDIFFKHYTLAKQKINSTAYKDRISKIVKKIMSNYSFAQLDINDTGNEGIFYQSLMTDFRFIQERLLPQAYSINSAKSPFYSYITSDNIYHLRNYNSIISSNTIATIEYKVLPGDGTKPLKNIATSIKRFRPELKEYWKLYNRDIYYIDRQNGEVKVDNDYITLYPPENNLKLPIANIGKDTTGISIEYLNFKETGDKENVIGNRVNSHNRAMFLNRFLLMIPFNPKLHSGNSINFKLYTMDKEGDKLSTTFSGNYIIEECEHIWDAEAQKGYTKLIIGRKYINVSNAYYLKGELI